MKGTVDQEDLYCFDNFQLQHLSSKPATFSLNYTTTCSVNNTLGSSFIMSDYASILFSASSCNKQSHLDLRQCRLGHPSLHVVQRALSSCNIKFSNKNHVSFCSSYILGKA